MPGQDKTGPLGQGATTGRGLGLCSGGTQKGFGRGGGFGFRCKHSTPIILTKEEKKRILEANLKEIEIEKQEIVKSLTELK